MKKALLFGFLILTFGISEKVAAAGKIVAAPKNSATAGLGQNKNGQVLDFEGEVIEGERKRPDLFLQISTKDLSFDSLLYLRNNYNDYLEVDRKGRNRYFRVKGK